MIKKVLLVFLIGFITGFVVTCVSTKAFSENKVQYIEKSFDNIRAEFFDKAEKIREGSLVSHFICKNKNSESYYLTVNVDHYVPQYIISIHARKEIRFSNETIEWYEEGIYLNQFVERYRHKIGHGIIYRIGNEFKEEELNPVEVWDDVITEFFGSNGNYKKTYNQIATNNEIENNINYIRKSFGSFKKIFFANAEISDEGISSCYHININIDSNTTHYIIVYTEGAPIRIITELWARKEVELGDGVVEIYNEGIYKDALEYKYQYSIYHEMLYRNNNCKTEQLKPVKIWDEVISFWLEKFDK
jgi:hypothetical protein